MSTVGITISGGRLGDPGPVLERELLRMATEAVALLEGAVKRGVPIGVTEAGRGSIAGEVNRGRVLPGQPIAAVGSPLKHVAVINDGRRPGQRPPPSQALTLWVRRKIRVAHEPAGRGRTNTRPLTDAEVRHLAIIIARSIGRKGIQGRQFFEAAIDDNWSTLERIFASGGLRIARELAGEGGGG
ncbi:hypothetical protein [Longimicrobium sp.]|uniref:hypothetical protein n=1 Tax=Longimicrobium sp. TaxID=2029185 RepID=UPI002E361076|nr:hypothetical protein [Longimicrobium sp.]HEX6038044.1 hypothetical protein [Longimicrobium sp.]